MLEGWGNNRMMDAENWRESIENIFEVQGPDMAIKAMEKSDNDIPELLKKLAKASIYFRWQKYEETSQLIESVSVDLPTVPHPFQRDWYVAAGGLAIFYERFNDALKILEEGLGKFPHDVRLLNQLALVNHILGHKKYELSYHELIQKFPDHPEVLVAYADFLFQHFQNQKAVEVAEKVLKLDENNVKALDMLGYIAVEKSENEKALQYFVRSAEIWPFNLNRLLTLCDLSMLSKDYKKAEKAYRYALKYYPESGELNLGFAALLLNLQGSDKEETLQHARKAAAALPDQAKSHLTLAYSYAYNNQWKKASEVLSMCDKFPSKPKGATVLRKEIEKRLHEH